MWVETPDLTAQNVEKISGLFQLHHVDTGQGRQAEEYHLNFPLNSTYRSLLRAVLADPHNGIL